MRRTARLAATVCVLAAAPALAAAAWMAPAATAGEPQVQAGTKGFWVWTDAKGVHVRWAGDGTPVLYSGRLALDSDAGEIVRVNKVAGGWVDVQNDRWIMFSSTTLKDVDGFDVVVKSGTTATLDLQVDGNNADPALVGFGKNAVRPKGLPAKFGCR